MSWPHVSCTQLAMLGRCPEQFRRRYLCDEKRPPGIAAHIGSGVHGGAELGMARKRESGLDVPPEDVADVAVARFDSRLQEDGVLLTPDEKSIGEAAVIGQARDRTAELGRFWAVNAQPEYSPDLIEHNFTVPLTQLDTSLTGIIDLVDTGGRIVDWKTAGKRFSESEVRTSLQLTAYAFAREYETRRPAGEVCFDVLVTAKATARQVLRASRTRADYDRLLLRIGAAVKQIRVGSYPPCNPGSWWCSTKFCGYANDCPYFPGE